MVLQQRNSRRPEREPRRILAHEHCYRPEQRNRHVRRVKWRSSHPTGGGITDRHGSVKLSGTPRFLESETECRATLITGQWPKVGDPAAISVSIFDGDPVEMLGISFDTVLVAGELGPMPQRQVIPDGSGPSTWVVLIPGRGAHRPSNNQYLPVMHELGLPTLSIAIRKHPKIQKVTVDSVSLNGMTLKQLSVTRSPMRAPNGSSWSAQAKALQYH